MRSKLLFLSFFISLFAHTQVDNELWLSGGAKYAYTKKLDFYGELNFRLDPNPVILNSFFTEFSAKYEVAKWFKPSVDYRIISDRNKFGNYHIGHRFNINANLSHDWNRFEFDGRVRLQGTFTRVRSTESSFSDLAPGVRVKTGVLYDINNSVISPTASCEWFFANDAYDGIYVNKIRASLGIDFEMIGPYNVSLKYMYGQSLTKAKSEHIVSFSFTRKYKRKKNKD
jgi:hypothetical protein|tara:strand:- start:5778 stop:6458 length:681 start_codon:yes stop_codon:yes gene_type:complete